MNKTFSVAVPIKPTKILKTPDARATIYLFGMPHDFGPHGNQKNIVETLKFYAARNGVKNIFAPSCKKFNAEIVCAENLPYKIRLRGGLMFHRGYFADGVILLKRKESFFVLSADCPTIVAIGEKVVIPAHGGRDSLIDNGEIHAGKPSRKHRSVVDAIIEKFFIAKENIKQMRIFITCGIKSENFPHSFDNPQHGAKNEAFIKYLLKKYGKSFLKSNPAEGLICLKDLIKAQFVLHGVPPENIVADDIDTYSDNILGKHLWHSCARGRTPKEKRGRNGVLVIRNF